MRPLVLFSIALMLGCALVAVRSAALPLFSRELSVGCAQCHTAAPRLNPYGMEFLQHGYRLPGGTALASAHAPPVSITANAEYELSAADSARVRVETDDRWAETPRSTFAIHSAGTLARNLTFRYAVEYRAATGLIATERAFLQLDDLTGRDVLNLRAGVFEVEAPYLSERRRTTLHSYLSPVALDAAGLEVNGEHAGWTYAMARVESHRHATGDDVAERYFGRFEDSYFVLMRGVGEKRISARMLFDRQDSGLPQHAWLQHLQLQTSGCLKLGPLEVIPAYTFDRFDDRPAAGMHERHQYGLVELFAPVGRTRRWEITVRGEHEYVTANLITREADRHLEVVDVGYRLYANVRIAAEWSEAGDNVGGPRLDRIGVGLTLGL